MRKILKYFFIGVGFLTVALVMLGLSYRLITGKTFTLAFASSGYDKYPKDKKERIVVKQPFEIVFRDLSSYIRYSTFFNTTYEDETSKIFLESKSTFNRFAHAMIVLKTDEAMEKYGSFFYCGPSEKTQAAGGSFFLIGDETETEVQFLMSIASTNIEAGDIRKDCSLKNGFVKKVLDEAEIR